MKENRLRIRLATRYELKIIGGFLRENWYLDFNKLLGNDINGQLVYVFEGYFNEVYSAKTPFKLIIDKLLEEGKHPYALGLHMGRLRKNRFVPSLELGYIASKRTKACVIVNAEGEKNFLYGKDLLARSIVNTKSIIHKGQVVILLNEDEEYIGIGKALENIVKKNNRIVTKQSGFIIKNIIDLGWYLRRGG